MSQLKTLLTTAILAAGLAGLAACNNPESAPEPENEVVAETMPETADPPAAAQAQDPAPAPAG
ncbi:MAG TPA: hypothetical protein VD906_09605 [Caulobacteraceae bacterium]|nr:hypothetical protein [Caulobacteraceae bacterium]